MENILKISAPLHTHAILLCWKCYFCEENWLNCKKSHMREIQFGNPFSLILLEFSLIVKITSSSPNVDEIMKIVARLCWPKHDRIQSEGNLIFFRDSCQRKLFFVPKQNLYEVTILQLIRGFETFPDQFLLANVVVVVILDDDLWCNLCKSF